MNWIKVEDGLPPIEDGWMEVLTVDSNGVVAASDFWGEEKEFWPPNGKGEYWGSAWHDITHWALLPEAPK